MNYVNLVGKIVSEPKVVELYNGTRIVKFSFSTSENNDRENGVFKYTTQRHCVIAWGKWVRIIEELGTCGLQLSIEGRLIHRFYDSNGKKQCVSEVEINDMVIL